MKIISKTHLFFLIISVFLCIDCIWNAYQSLGDNAGFFYELGMAMIWLSLVYGFLFYGPERLARMGMTMPEIYKSARVGKGNQTYLERALSVLGFGLLLISGYYKFFAD